MSIFATSWQEVVRIMSQTCCIELRNHDDGIDDRMWQVFLGRDDNENDKLCRGDTLAAAVHAAAERVKEEPGTPDNPPSP